MSDIRDRAVDLYDAFTHEHRDRRTLLRQMTALAGSVAAAETLILGLAASPAAAAITSPDDPKIFTRRAQYAAGGAMTTGYFAEPKDAKGKLGSVVVIHENRGLNAHIEDVARRLALAGFFVLAPDFLSAEGGTPADEDKARDMIAKLDLQVATSIGVESVRRLAGLKAGSGKAAVIGFCWGGALADRVAVAGGDHVAAAVSYYGPAPTPAEATKVVAPMMFHFAGKDARVAATGEPFVAALKAAKKPVEVFTYPDVDHAFNNDTSAERYNKAAADLAWGRTVAFLHKHVDA